MIMLFRTPPKTLQSKCLQENMHFLSVNTEGQSPTCPTTKNRDEKFIRVARPRNGLLAENIQEPVLKAIASKI